MDSQQRKDLKEDNGTDLDSLFAHAEANYKLNYAGFSAQAGKKNFGENLSRHLEMRFAAALSRGAASGLTTSSPFSSYNRPTSSAAPVAPYCLVQ